MRHRQVDAGRRTTQKFHNSARNVTKVEVALRSRWYMLIPILLVTSLALAGCGGLTADQQKINQFIYGLTPQTAGPPSETSGTAAKSNQTINGVQYACESTPKTLTADPSDIVAHDADSGKMWLGALLQGKGYAGGLGSLAELPVRERAPLTIYTDLPGKHISRQVDIPDGASAQQAVNDLILDAQRQGISPAADLTDTERVAHSAEQALLDAGISVKYLGAEGSAKLNIDTSATTSSVLFEITQRLFTVKIVKPATPAEYFATSFKYGDLTNQVNAGRIGQADPPVVVSQISFGRKLIYTATAEASVSDLEAALTASYDGGAVSGQIHLTDDQKKLVSNTHFNVVAVGGDQAATINLLKTHSVGDYLNRDLSLVDARPISFQVDNVVNDTAAAFSETTTYNLQTCQPVPPGPAKLAGVVVQVGGLQGYNNCKDSAPWLFGDLFINGQQVWHAGDNSDPRNGWNIPEGLGLFSLRRDPDAKLPKGVQQDPKYGGPTLGAGQFALIDGQPPGLQVTGAIKEHNTFGGPPTNLYNMSYSFPLSGGVALGAQMIKGNSPHCDVWVTFSLDKVADLYLPS